MTAEDRIDQLRADLALAVRDRVANGVCGCSCGEALPPGGSGRRRYLNDRHRQRAYQHRLELEAKVRGIPARLSLEALSAPTSTDERPSDAQIAAPAPQAHKPRRPRPGISVYFATPGDLRRLDEWLATTAGRPVWEDLAPAVAAIRAAVDRRAARDRREAGR